MQATNTTTASDLAIGISYNDDYYFFQY